MVIRKIFFFVFIFVFFINNNLFASRILDYETELFIENIIDKIKEANKINRDIKFIIISNKNINAYVDQNNIIYVTSGLIENCIDYVAFLSVVAHEIGHIHKNHISQRKLKKNNFKNINQISNLSIIAGSLVTSNPQVLQGIALSSASISETAINFNKDQEREADYYSLNTLEHLNLYSNSIINLLKTIEKKGLEKGLTKENLKTSSHPYFEERIEIIKYVNKKQINILDEDTNDRFKYIKSKYLGYNGNEELISKLENPYKKYANSILKAKNGNLKDSLKDLNDLISKNKDNIFLLETKADILFSYGYMDESIQFYQNVLNYYPNNLYAQIRVFENINLNKLSQNEKDIFFLKNLNLLEKYYNNKNILLTYLRLSEDMHKKEWINFLDYWINKKNDKKIVKKNIIKFKKTNDKYLLKLIELIYKDLV